MSESIGQRKSDHLTLCAEGNVAFRTTTTLFEHLRLMHNALPDLAMNDLDTTITVLGKRLRVPFLIAAMTGGTDEAARVNEALASVAETRGIAFGLGSQRAMALRPSAAASYRVRDSAPTTLVFGNLGIVQARTMPTADIRNLVDDVGADALCIHLNPAMELVQPGGDRDFRGGIDTLARLVRDLGVPVIAKETGCGLSHAVGLRLREVGVVHADVSGAGGTSWVGVETRRAEDQGDAKACALGEAFWDWGIPTAASVGLLAPLGFETLIATGGMATGLQAAKALALGAHLVGVARPMLQALRRGGEAAVHALFDQMELELRAAMLLTGSRSLEVLRDVPRVITGELAAWLTPR
jgi:isopentenyl-diphosphate delta-isomerase